MSDTEAAARDIRVDALRQIRGAGSGHPGGCLSCADLLAVLYFEEMNVRPDEPGWVDRDKLALSKGHAAPALYAALARRGYFPATELASFRKLGGLLQGHPDVAIPGVDAPSGSLGLGLSQGLGMALDGRYRKSPARAYVILGDGDMEEGNTWEALMAAGHHRTARLTAILDNNGLQGDASVVVQMNYGPIADKVKAFGWHVQTIDGHDHRAIADALHAARGETERPSFIEAKTIKGKGISFMEGDNSWHGSRGLTDDEYAAAMAELGVAS